MCQGMGSRQSEEQRHAVAKEGGRVRFHVADVGWSDVVAWVVNKCKTRTKEQRMHRFLSFVSFS